MKVDRTYTFIVLIPKFMYTFVNGDINVSLASACINYYNTNTSGKTLNGKSNVFHNTKYQSQAIISWSR